MTGIFPAQVWWTAQELAAAGLPDMPTHRANIERWIARINLRANPSLARRRAGRGGGWEYHWSALPLAARKALLVSAVAPASAPVRDRGEFWAWFEALPEGVQGKARHRLRAVQSVEALEIGLGRDLAVREVAQIEGVSPRSLWSWLGLIEGVRPDDRLPHLAPKHRAAARKVARAEFDEEAFDWLKADYLRLAGPSFSSCWRRAERVARGKGWIIAPDRTMRRYLDARVSQPVQVLARKGLDALKRMYPPQVRDKTALHALEVVNGDFHRFDVFVAWPGLNTPVRPQMVAFQDIYSGRILSWRLDLTANSNAVLLAAGDMIADWGIPEHVVLDNGREFAAKLITGGTQTRFRFKVREDDIPGLFVGLGCEIHWATPYAGQGLERDIDMLRKGMADADAWAQEYELQWLDEASAWLPYDLITPVEHPAAGLPGLYQGGPCFVGVDIAARRDLFVIWVDELVGDVAWPCVAADLGRPDQPPQFPPPRPQYGDPDGPRRPDCPGPRARCHTCSGGDGDHRPAHGRADRAQPRDHPGPGAVRAARRLRSGDQPAHRARNRCRRRA